MDTWSSITIICAGISTLAIFSFLIKENHFYRFFEYFFIGIAAGYVPIVTIKTFLWPQILEPLLGLTVIHYPDGTVEQPYNYNYLWYVAPFLFGFLYYFIYSRKYGWVAKIVISFSLGASAGLGFQGFFAEILPQLFKSFKPLVVIENGQFQFGEMINHLLFLLILLSVMYYFFFTFRRSTALHEKIAIHGRLWMMVCFGAFFGSTVMARLALLVERMQFLINSFWPTLLHLVYHS